MKGAVPIAWEQSCVPVTGRKTIAFYIHKRWSSSCADNCGKNSIFWFWFEYLLSGWKSYRDFEKLFQGFWWKKKAKERKTRRLEKQNRRAKHAKQGLATGHLFFFFLCKVTPHVLNTARERWAAKPLAAITRVWGSRPVLIPYRNIFLCNSAG